MDARPLYHYTKTDIAKKIIENLQLKLSFSPKVNDPFDLGKDIIYDPDDTDGCELFETICTDDELHRLKPNFSQARTNSNKEHVLSVVTKFIKEWGFKQTILATPFLCFSERKDIPLMWSLYGDGCRGMVLEFSGGPFTKAEKVIYESYEKLPSVITKERLISFLKNNDEEILKFGRDLLIKKHDDWDYEEEERLIFDPRPNAAYIEQDGQKFYKFNSENLIGIYFGSNCSSKDIEDVTALLKKQSLNHVKLYKMIRNPGYIKIFPKEIKLETCDV